ncbi:hypothetical protein BJ170DRAFT_63734 [Xylariales sp. AK1849]|nr:hypothetical protein BJ170DRAFT_63734 [Xylariales sp. AK1849]
MAANYSEVAQEDDDRNDGPSPPLSLSPALSSSPMPLLRSVESTLTPLSMDSDSYPSHVIEGNMMDDSGDNYGKSALGTATTKPIAVNLARSVTESARATAANIESENEYDLLSPGSTDAASSGSVNEPSPKLGIAHTQVNLLPVNKTRSRTASHRDNASPNASTEQNSTQNPHCALTEGSASAELGSPVILQQPNIVKPTAVPRTASTRSVTLIHPSPSVRSRSSSHTSNVAQLEATAEKLSLTSSIEVAIRDLHEEQKRSDSRRSSILAASIGETFPFLRQVSGATSILETNSTARIGGYSPAGYVMSPNNSLLSNPSRLRSGSYNRSETDSNDLLSRNGPGRSSARSSRSTNKPSLTDIFEMEPTGLTLAAMDEADRLGEEPEEETLRLPPLEDIDLTPNKDPFHHTSSTNDYWDQAVAQAQMADTQHHGHHRPKSPSGSTNTFEEAETAFADFDGAHCSPDEHYDSFDPHFNLDPSLYMPPPDEDVVRPRIPRPNLPTARPKSYMDPDTGQQMLYYPAPVPQMLNLPQKLSKRPKASERDKRRSQVLSAMPEPSRQSAAWLPEVLSEPLFDPLGLGSNPDLSTPVPRPDSLNENPLSPPPLDEEIPSHVRPNPRTLNEEARRSRMSIGMPILDPVDKRKPRMSYKLDNLPPQLRASAFFDMPSESPAIELKDGSAMATLDSILDASAAAPVSAFTDHAFAGKLGDEIYGTEKKRKSHVRLGSTGDIQVVKKRSSIFHLRTPSKLSIRSKEDRRDTITGSKLASEFGNGESDDERTKLSGSIDGEPVVHEHEEEDRGDSDEDPALNCPPTTLLAELQIRKKQQKLRTRPVVRAYPNGLHSTLLEMDTVAELERRNRKGKKVNLAWEEPNEVTNESDDEDVPLGLLAVAKNGGIERHVLQAGVNRPLGLMERRELEDNEPLSSRRDRIQGRPVITKRQSMMTIGSRGALGMSGGLGPPSPSMPVDTPEQAEVEGETLGERIRRLRGREDTNNLLPDARPVSAAFSVELLSQFGDTFKEKDKAEPGSKGRQNSPPPEEEETLGQRRRRLQAEREAREKEMGAGGAFSPPAMPTLTKRHSMADVLGASARTVLRDPRADNERAKQAEAERFRRDQDRKFAALRAQMPTNLSTPNRQRSGGYMSGQFNDGTGGKMARSRVSSTYGAQMPGSVHQMTMNGGVMNGGVMGNTVYGGGMSGYGMPNGYGYGMPLQQIQMTQMPMQQPGQHYDIVDRWRQSIVP